MIIVSIDKNSVYAYWTLENKRSIEPMMVSSSFEAETTNQFNSPRGTNNLKSVALEFSQ